MVTNRMPKQAAQDAYLVILFDIQNAHEQTGMLILGT
jgi:hypothetical protein